MRLLKSGFGATWGALLLWAPVTFAREHCDKTCLERIGDQYRTAYVRHEPGLLPLAKQVRFSENGVLMTFPDASWDTITREVGPAVTISDARTGQVGIYTAIWQNDTPGFLAIRLKIEDGRISQIEHMISTVRNLSGPPTPIGDIEKYQPDPNFSATVPVAQRAPRARLIPHADGYFNTLNNNTGEIRGTRFAADAQRIENGRLFPEIEKGFRLGYYAFNNRVRREHLLVDEERQVVMSRGFIDHKGVMDNYTLTDGTTRRSPYREPHTWAFLEMFKINDDHITSVQAVFIGAPYNMESPWKK
ncbi:MAG: hypothetical protein ABW278_01695 [Steroidobacteraceae bacterium]